MVKEIIKTIFAGIVSYPLCLLLVYLEGDRGDDVLVVVLVLDIIVTIGISIYKIRKLKKII